MKKNILFVLCISLLFASPLMSETTHQLEHLRVQKILVEVVGDERPTKEASILSRLKVKQGDYFSQEDFDEDLKTLARDYDRIEPQIQVIDGSLVLKLR